MDNEDSARLLAAYVAGDDDAATRIFDKYVHRLIGLAQTRLSPVLRRRVDAQDVVQSAFRSFFRKAGNDELTLKRSGDLWRLLAAFTINKVNGQVEHELVGKRDARIEESGVVLQKALSAEPTPEAVTLVIDEVEMLMGELKSRDRCILELRLQGESVPAIATEVANEFGQVSQATIRRTLRDVRSKLRQRLLSQ